MPQNQRRVALRESLLLRSLEDAAHRGFRQAFGLAAIASVATGATLLAEFPSIVANPALLREAGAGEVLTHMSRLVAMAHVVVAVAVVALLTSKVRGEAALKEATGRLGSELFRGFGVITATLFAVGLRCLIAAGPWVVYYVLGRTGIRYFAMAATPFAVVLALRTLLQYSFALPLALLEKLPIKEAISMSRTKTQGHLWQLLALYSPVLLGALGCVGLYAGLTATGSRFLAMMVIPGSLPLLHIGWQLLSTSAAAMRG